jgi:hypothetical protein
MLTRTLAIMAGISIANVTAAKDWTTEEKAVWQLEEDYWRFVSAGNVDSYVKLWHDDFVGWPCFECTPRLGWKPLAACSEGLGAIGDAQPNDL